MTVLPTRQPTFTVPKYSITGDIISFKRCGLQYRYLNYSALPPSRPIQMWFGEFIHSVLELAVRNFQEGHLGNLPWPADTIVSEICDPVSARLAAEGKTPRSRAAEENARNRAIVAINKLGPLLFPLVDATEVNVSGTRHMPQQSQFRAKYFEVTGRIDVVSSLRLADESTAGNPIAKLIHASLPSVVSADPFEILVDYKGTRRPPTDSEEAELYERQLQTYAWLRTQQPESLPVRAGMVVFINELLPSQADMVKLSEDIAHNRTEVLPGSNSTDQRIVLGSRRGESPYGLSWEFRLARALKVVPVERSHQDEALSAFDDVVGEIESSVHKEVEAGSIQQSWQARPADETCIACDFQTVCRESPYAGPALAPLGRRAVMDQ